MRPYLCILWLAAAGGCTCGERAPSAPSPQKPAVEASTPEPVKPAPKTLLDENFAEAGDAKDWSSWVHHLGEGAWSLAYGAEGLTVNLETYGRAAEEVSVVALRYRGAQEVLTAPKRFRLAMEWLEDSNSNYLSAGLALVPSASPDGGDPRDLPEAVHLSFIGSGDEGRARRELVVNRRGSAIHRETEGWPKVEPQGRKVGKTELILTVGASVMRLEEAGREPVSISHGPGFAEGNLVLFVASHSNSMRRAVRFTNLAIEAVD